MPAKMTDAIDIDPNDLPVQVHQDKVIAFGVEIPWTLAHNMSDDLRRAAEMAEVHWLAVEVEVAKLAYRRARIEYRVNKDILSECMGVRVRQLISDRRFYRKTVTGKRHYVRLYRIALEHLIFLAKFNINIREDLVKPEDDE